MNPSPAYRCPTRSQGLVTLLLKPLTKGRFKLNGKRVWLSGLLLLLVSALNVAGADRKILAGHVPQVVSGANAIGRMPSQQRLKLAIGLPLRNRSEMEALLQQIYEPRSSNYRQYLTPAQFTERFGPTEDSYRAVQEFAQTNGFKVTGVHPNRVLVDVEASVGDIERAFHINLNIYPHPREARNFYAPANEPSVDASVPILDISGLDNFALPRPAGLKQKAAQAQPSAAPNAGSGPSGSYRGYDFRAAYAPGVALTGAGQVVGLLQFDGYNTSDITLYETTTGLPNVPLQNVLLDGFNGSAGNNNAEVALDIEMSISMAPGLAKVIVYEAGPSGIPNDILNRMATDNQAKQLSSSWTWSPFNSTADQIFQQFALQGQSFYQASGDSDAYSGSVSKPADDPYITIVGGTTLTTTGPGGSWVSEVVWNWGLVSGSYVGTGGGISTSYAIPSWQQPVNMSNNKGSTTMRNLPDVALTADNIAVAYNGGSWGIFGGTSCAAPLWAGFTALINQQAAANGLGTVGFVNPAIYSLGLGSGYSSAFHDITSGNNTSSSSPNAFYAVAGYDLCTGWGTPKGSGLINALAGSASPNVVAAGFGLAAENCPNGAVDPGETVTVDFSLSNAGTANTTNLVATLLSGGGVTSPSTPQTYGVLQFGGPSVSQSFSFTAGGTCGGTLTATLQLQDGSANLGNVSFSLPLGQIAGPPLVQNFDGVTTPGLPSGWASTVVSGAAANWVTTTANSDSAPNSAFVTDSTAAGANALVSPAVPIVTSTAQLSFRQNYNLEFRTRHGTTYYDGGVLEISVGGGAFTDIQTAGGSFVSGGYNGTLTTGSGNPLGGRQAWGGNSSGWITSTVNLPAAVAGQTIQLRWNLGTSSGNAYGGVGWYVDSIVLQDNYSVCCVPSANLAVAQAAAPEPVIDGQTLSYTLSVTNFGPSSADNVVLTDSLPSSVTFVSASPGCINVGNTVVCNAGTLTSGSSSNFVLTVTATTAGLATNIVSVSSSTPNANLGNNLVMSVVRILAPPSLTGLTSAGPGMAISLTSVPGLTYTLEYKSSLDDPTWTPLLPSIDGTGSSLTLQDTNALTTSRFYRVLCQ